MKHLSLLLLAILLGCNHSNIDRISIFNDTLKYDNGNAYCFGKYQQIIKDGDTNFVKQGEWKYNYPNGTLWSIDNLDEDGKTIESSSYYYKGGLKELDKNSGDIEESKYFNENGTMVSYSIDKNEQANAERRKIQQFYDNGMILEEYLWLKDKLETDVFYDSSGKKILDIIYWKGRWVKR